MANYYMGYYYEMPKSLDNDGWTLTAGRLCFPRVTKASANKLKAQLVREGVDKNDIEITKN